MARVMDGNSVFQCKKDETHRFWIHPFSFLEVHWHPKATNTDWDYFLKWIIEKDDNGEEKFIPQPLETDQTVRTINSMFENEKSLLKWLREAKKKNN